MEEKSPLKKKNNNTGMTNPPAEAASLLTDDLIVEILSRLPARSVHRFKVGPRFHDFHFADVSISAATPIDPSLRFLPRDKYWYVAQLDACNGLLLCRGYMPSSPSAKDDDVVESCYILCNPATERWLHLPPHPKVPPGGRVFPRLTFDPAVSSYFHVLQFEETDQKDYITGVTIYSSQTGDWKRRESRLLLEKISLYSGIASVFFHGMLHLLGWLRPMKIDVDDVLVSVDMEGQVWKTIRVPSGGMSFGIIGLSQGCLHYATTPLTRVVNKKKKEEENTSLATKREEVWYMKDYDSKEWVLKHSFSEDELRTISGMKYNKVAAIHPECDTIFLVFFNDDTLASYDTQHRKFRRILNLEKNKAALFVPYVPLFSDSFAGADGQ
ncbi:hypothetical protein ACQ4PT_007539 [Festuca glaucescens]